MQVTDELIRSVIQDVLTGMRQGNGRPVHAGNGKPAPAPSGNGRTRSWGVFDDVDSAVAAATKAQREFERRGLDERKQAVDCIRRICLEQKEQLGREELEETKIGRLEHKIEKLQVVGEKIPGVEFLRTDAFSGGNGI